MWANIMYWLTITPSGYSVALSEHVPLHFQIQDGFVLNDKLSKQWVKFKWNRKIPSLNLKSVLFGLSLFFHSNESNAQAAWGEWFDKASYASVEAMISDKFKFAYIWIAT